MPDPVSGSPPTGAARREHEMTEDQLAALLDASKPVPYMVFGGVEPASPQQNANAAWRSLARDLGFDWRTVQAVTGKGNRFFTAMPSGVSQ